MSPEQQEVSQNAEGELGPGEREASIEGWLAGTIQISGNAPSQFGRRCHFVGYADLGDGEIPPPSVRRAT